MFGVALLATDDLAWLTAPSLIPWMGAVAALVAAFVISARPWLKSPWWLVPRLLGIIGVWFIAVLVLGWLFPPPEKPPPETVKPPPVASAVEAVHISPGQVPSGIPGNAILVVTFVATEGDAQVARDFACDLLLLSGEATEKVEIRAQGMAEFEKLLVEQLRRVPEPANPSQTSAVVMRVPFPGEGVLRRVRQKVQAVLPGVSVITDGGAP